MDLPSLGGLFIGEHMDKLTEPLVLSAEQTIPYLQKIEGDIALRDAGGMVTRLTAGEAHKLCNMGWVQGRIANRKDKATNEKSVVLRYLILLVSQTELRAYLTRLVRQAGRLIAEDCQTTSYWIDGYMHNGKNKYYAGGPARLGVIVAQ